MIAAFLEPDAAEDLVAEDAVVTLPGESADEKTDDLIEEIVAEVDALAVYQNSFAEESALVGAERISLAAEVAAEETPAALPDVEVAEAECEVRFAEFCARAAVFFEQANLAEPTVIGAKVSTRGEFAELVNACGQLTQVESEFAAPWPESAKRVLPTAIAVPGTWSPTQRFAPVLAWLLIERLVGSAVGSVNAVELFDMLHLRSALAEIFSSLGIDRESAWRVAARVRILLANPEVTTSAKLAEEKLWADGDLRWLACLSESGDVTYVNKECFEELAWWLQVPELIVAAGLEGSARAEAIEDVEAFIAAVSSAASEAGYDLAKILATLSGVKIEEVDVETETIAAETEVEAVPEPEPETVAKG